MQTRFITSDYSLKDTLTCGQCFRFTEQDDGSFLGVMGDHLLSLTQNGDCILVCSDSDIPETETARFFGFSEDYSAINGILCRDPVMAEMVRECSGIRIMAQPFWETLASFVISQNNNIPRIAGIINRLCECFGEDRGGFYAFPSAEKLAALEPDALAPLRCGYRAPYLIDAAKRVAGGHLEEDYVRNLPLEEARKLLMTVNGVGPKVADCTLLFGAGRLDAFPKDVWIKKAMARYFPSGLREDALPYAGIAQQYIFHYARSHGLE